MTNLRDWQKKASERKTFVQRECDKIYRTAYNCPDVSPIESIQVIANYAFHSRDAEIDLLLQIIEKQSEALDVYAMTNETFPEYGDVARTTKAEVKQIVERLINE